MISQVCWEFIWIYMSFKRCLKKKKKTQNITQRNHWLLVLVMSAVSPAAWAAVPVRSSVPPPVHLCFSVLVGVTARLASHEYTMTQAQLLFLFLLPFSYRRLFRESKRCQLVQVILETNCGSLKSQFETTFLFTLKILRGILESVKLCS